MPSATHEGVIEVFRQEPTFVAKVLREILKIDLPRFNRVHFSEATLRERGVTRHADALALFDNKNQPVFVSILEVQLYVDDAKLYSWPFYAIVARTHHTCPCALLVVTTTRATERWASRPIDLGGGNTFRPLVLGPSNIPMVIERDRALRDPPLALLSALAHGKPRTRTAIQIVTAAIYAAISLPDETRMLYLSLLQDALRSTVRKVQSMAPQLRKFFSETQRRFHNEGKAEGKAESVLVVLSQRGLVPTSEQQRRIALCTDAAALDRWLKRALTAASIDELLAPKPPAKATNGHATKAKPRAARKARPAR